MNLMCNFSHADRYSIIKLFQSMVVNTSMDITDARYICLVVLVADSLSDFFHVTLIIFLYFLIIIIGYQPLIFHPPSPLFLWCCYFNLFCRAYNIAKLIFDHTIVNLMRFL